MNNVPNSDSEQCTESKLSRMHSAPTLGPGCAQAASAMHHVMELTGPYPSPLPGRVAPVPEHVAARMRAMGRSAESCRAAPCHSPSGCIVRRLRRIVAHARPYRSTAARRVTTCLTIHPATKPPSYHNTPIFFFSFCSTY